MEMLVKMTAVLVKIGDDDGPRQRSGATGSKGERAPLLILLP